MGGKCCGRRELPAHGAIGGEERGRSVRCGPSDACGVGDACWAFTPLAAICCGLLWFFFGVSR